MKSRNGRASGEVRAEPSLLERCRSLRKRQHQTFVEQSDSNTDSYDEDEYRPASRLLERTKEPGTAKAIQRKEKGVATVVKAQGGKHQCEICSKTFARFDRLKYHMQMHNNDRPFPCPHCSSAFRMSSHLKNHIQGRHSSDAEKERCANCNKLLSCTTSLRRHMKICGQDLGNRIKFNCSDCGKGFTTQDGYEKHQVNIVCVSMNTIRHQPQRIFGTTEAGAKDAEEGETDADTAIKSERVEFSCSKCGQSFEESAAKDCHQRFLCGVADSSSNHFECPECPKVFSKYNLFAIHARFHSGHRPYSCTQCSAKFITKNSLGGHIDRHKDRDKGVDKLACTLCDASYRTKQSLQMHIMRVHCGLRPYKCNECDQDFVHARQLSNHIKRIHRKEQPYQCMLCTKSFFEAYEWRNHMLEHVKTVSSIITQHAANPCETDHISQTDIIIALAATGTSSVTSENHMSNEQSSGDSAEASSSILNAPCTTSSAPLGNSGSQANSLRDLQSVLFDSKNAAPKIMLSDAAIQKILQHASKFSHKKANKKQDSCAVTGTRKQAVAEYPCGICGETFTMSRLKQHISSTHADVPDAMQLGQRQVCCLCAKETPTPSALYQHKFIMHHRVGKFACPQCDKVFSVKPRLTRHMIVHTDEMPYQCDQCPAAFKWKVSLDDHIADIHNPDIEVGADGKRFTCTTCGKRFARSNLLKVHKKLHQDTLPCICFMCGKGFINNTRLRVHMSSHNDGSNAEKNRPHVCEYCGQGYFYAHLLRRHIRSRHLDHSDWICTICGKGLTTKYSLQQHIKLHSRNPESTVKRGCHPNSHKLKAKHALHKDLGDFTTQKKSYKKSKSTAKTQAANQFEEMATANAIVSKNDSSSMMEGDALTVDKKRDFYHQPRREGEQRGSGAYSGPSGDITYGELRTLTPPEVEDSPNPSVITCPITPMYEGDHEHYQSEAWKYYVKH